MRANVPFFRPILGGITIGYAKNQAARSGVVTLPTEPNHQQKEPANGCPTEAYAPALHRFAYFDRQRPAVVVLLHHPDVPVAPWGR